MAASLTPGIARGAFDARSVSVSLTGDGPVYRVRIWSVLVLSDLAIQYLLGMYVNLFVALPTSWSRSTMMGMMGGGGSGVLMVHMMNGYLLGLLGVIGLLLAAMSRRVDLVSWSTLGLMGIAFAGLSGLAFMFTGFTVNAWSFLMAAGSLLSFGSYFVVLTLSWSARDPTRGPDLGPGS